VVSHVQRFDRGLLPRADAANPSSASDEVPIVVHQPHRGRVAEARAASKTYF